MAKYSHYAIKVGRIPGIYTQWYGADGASEQIDGFKGARFRGFHSKYEAEVWLGIELQKRYDKLVNKLVDGDDAVLPELEQVARNIELANKKLPWED